MSDASSAVTCTSVYTDSEPWRYYEEDSVDIGPPRVIVYGYNGLLIQQVAPPSPDYVPGPEHPPSPDYVPDPEHPPSPIEIPYVPEPEYPETDIPKADMPPRKKVCLTTLALGFEIGESSAAGATKQPGPTESNFRRCRVEQAGYGITDTSSAIAAHVRTLETQALIDRGVAAALAEHDADRSRNGDNSNDSGTSERRQRTNPRECSYTDFLKQDVAYAMPWATLKRMITDKYCPRGKIQKLESEYWNLKVKGIDLLNYNYRFQELALMCDIMFPEELAKVERYIGGLPDMIHGSVKASKPQSMQE
nr:reverse transcriptase domain-containing protein [Tanacetum cinerariifolium]